MSSPPPAFEHCLEESLVPILFFPHAVDSSFTSAADVPEVSVGVAVDDSPFADGVAEAFIFPLLFSTSVSFGVSTFRLGAATTVAGSADSCVLNIT